MGRSARREAIVKLREQIAAATDPEVVIRLTRQLSKLLPKKKAVMGRPRTTPAQSPVTSPESTYVPNGSMMDDLPLGEQTALRVVLALEAERKRRGFAGEREMTQTERSALINKTKAGFSDEERAALAAYECA
jgi:hypothetical protein